MMSSAPETFTSMRFTWNDRIEAATPRHWWQFPRGFSERAKEDVLDRDKCVVGEALKRLGGNEFWHRHDPVLDHLSKRAPKLVYLRQVYAVARLKKKAERRILELKARAAR